MSEVQDVSDIFDIDVDVKPYLTFIIQRFTFASFCASFIRYLGSQAAIMFLASNICWVSSGTVRALRREKSRVEESFAKQILVEMAGY